MPALGALQVLDSSCSWYAEVLLDPQVVGVLAWTVESALPLTPAPRAADWSLLLVGVCTVQPPCAEACFQQSMRWFSNLHKPDP